MNAHANFFKRHTKSIKTAAKMFLVLAAFSLASLVMEFGVRVFDPQIEMRYFGAYDFGCLSKGTYYWIRMKPNRECILKSTIGAFNEATFETNSLGLRNREIVSPKPSGTTRILFVGDSYTVGWGGVSQDEAFPQLTERLLKEALSNTNIETVNAGLTATEPGYYYLFLKNELGKIDADIVVIGFYLFNDIAENLFYSDWKEVDEAGLPIEIDSFTNYISFDGNIYAKEVPFRYTIPFLRDSHLFLKLSGSIPESKIKPFHSNFVSPYYCFYKEACHDLDEEKRKAKMLFSAIKKLTQENGQKLLVTFIPAEFQINPNTISKYLKAPLLPSDKEYPYQYFIQFFTEEGINYLDLREEMRIRDVSDGPLYFERDTHWNSAGHKVAAEAISKKLLDDYLKN